MKRLFSALILILLIAVCVLSACDGGNESESSMQSVEAQSTEESVGESQVSVDESNDGSVDESKESESVESAAESKTESDDESTDESIDEGIDESSEASGDESVDELAYEPAKVLYTRYTQKPYFVMIGTCSQGAQITAEFKGQSVTVDSYMGWFELTLKNETSADILGISFTQSICGKTVEDTKTLQVKPTEPAYKGTRAIGSNGAFQFFLEKMVADYEGNNRYADSVIASMTARVSDRLDYIHSYNSDAEIIYMIVPSPMTVYPELVPDYYTKGTGVTRYEQVKKGLLAAGATVIDLRDTFNEHKNDEMPLYYKLDSHWADYGAYLAYVDLFNHISKKYTAAKPRPIDDFTWTADYYTSADACLYLDIPQVNVKEYGYYREFNFADPANITSVPRYRGMQLIYNDLTTEEKYFSTGNTSLPSCIVYRDSYCAGIYDLIPERMNKTHYMGMWGYAWQNWLIDSEKPDYIIYIIAEWNMNEVVYN